MKHFIALKDFFIENKRKYIIGILWLIGVDVLQLLIPKILGVYTDALKTGTLTSKNMLFYGFLIIIIAFFYVPF